MKILLLFTIIYSLFPLLFYWIIKRNLTLEIKPILPFVILSFVGGIYEFVFTSKELSELYKEAEIGESIIPFLERLVNYLTGY